MAASRTTRLPHSEPESELALALHCAAGALALLFVLDPATSGAFPPCPFRALTGLLCPGCGTLRGLHHLLHGDALTAFRFNPLMLLALPFVAASFASRALRFLTGAPAPASSWPAGGIWALLGLVSLYAALRNTAFYPDWFLR